MSSNIRQTIEFVKAMWGHQIIIKNHIYIFCLCIFLRIMHTPLYKTIHNTYCTTSAYVASSSEAGGNNLTYKVTKHPFKIILKMNAMRYLLLSRIFLSDSSSSFPFSS